jgi:hypothetical protein
MLLQEGMKTTALNRSNARGRDRFASTGSSDGQTRSLRRRRRGPNEWVAAFLGPCLSEPRGARTAAAAIAPCLRRNSVAQIATNMEINHTTAITSPTLIRAGPT